MEYTADDVADIALLIERGDLDHARRLAEELLQVHPNSAPAHALLGDIAAAHREHREAMDWYELSLRLADSPAVAARLERQRALLAAANEAEIDDLLDRPTGNRRLLMAGIGAAFIAVVVIVWLVAGSLPRQKAPPGGPPRPTTPAGASVRPGAPAASLPQTGSAPVTAGGRPGTAPLPALAPPSPGGPNLSGHPINQTFSVDGPMSNRDRLLSRALAGLTWSDGQALGWRVQAVVDEYMGYALVTAQVAPGYRMTDLSGAAIDMAYKLAVATIQADKGINSLTIRLLMEVEADNKHVVLQAFRGNTTRDHLDYYLKRGLQPDRQTIWQHVFATTWWNPSVPTGTAEAPATP